MAIASLKAFTSCTLALVVVFVGNHWAAASPTGTHFDVEDFQNDTPGLRPLTAAYRSEDGLPIGNPPVRYARGIVVGDTVGADPEGTPYPADPFGPAGNQSLLIEDQRDIANAPKVGFGTHPLTVDTFSAKLYFFEGVDNNITWGKHVSEIRLGRFDYVTDGHSSIEWWDQDLGSAMGIWLRWSDADGTGIKLRLGMIDTSVFPWEIENLLLDNATPYNTPFEIAVSFDTTTDTMTGTLDGVPLTADAGQTTVFPFAYPQTEITAVEFVGGYTNYLGVRYFVDDVTLGGVAATADFDGDLVVGGSDFLKWQRSYLVDDGGDANHNVDRCAPFSPTTPPSSNCTNTVDLGLWEDQYGTVFQAPLGAGSAVPEPSSLLLVLLGGAIAFSTAHRPWHRT